MTRIDITDSRPYCTCSDLVKYQRLGLAVEEIVEVAMKLSSLKTLGIHLRIEGTAFVHHMYLIMCAYSYINPYIDLFDDEGFSLSDINETVVGAKSQDKAVGINFLDLEDDHYLLNEEDGNGSSQALFSTLDDEVDLLRVKVHNHNFIGVNRPCSVI